MLAHHPPGLAPVLLLLAGLAACDLPRDPHGTRADVRGGALRAGIAGDADNLAAERARVEDLAARLDARAEFTTGETHALVEALEDGRLHLVVSLPESTPFARRLGLTRPVAKGTAAPRVWAVRAGENAWLFEVNAFLAGAGEP